MSDDLTSIVQSIGTFVRTGSDVVDLIQKVRGLVGYTRVSAG